MGLVRRGFIARNPNWSEHLYIPKREKSKYIQMRPNQLYVYRNHQKSRFMIIRQPPGAGKSATIKFVFADLLQEDENKKIIITIPQNIISSSFGLDYLEYPNRNKITWQLDPLNDLSLCYESKINRIVEFLKKKKFPSGIHERILLCSHSGFVQACQRMKKVSFKNTIVVIDEAHHVQASGDELTLNNLGQIVKKIINSKDESCGLWFTTATYFRGDGVDILSEKDSEKFDTYFLSLDEYFETLKYIQTYSYDFIPYKGDFPSKEMQYLLSKNKNRKKTIIYVPAIGRLWAEKHKNKTVEKIIKAIHKTWENAKIIDLVTEDGRENRKKELMNNKFNSDIDIVLAVNLLDEGTDWPEAEQIFDLAPTESLRIANQRFGRLLRDRCHKKHIAYYTFFPYILDFKDEEKSRMILSKSFAALSASFMLEESIVPVKLPKNKSKNKKNEIQSKEKINYFRMTVEDPNIRDNIKREIFEEIVKLTSKNEEDEIVVDNYKKCIMDVLKQYGVSKNKKKIAQEIELELTRRVVPKFDTSIDGIVEAGFDIIKWKKISEYIYQFVSGKCGKKVLKKFREYYDKQNKTVDEWVIFAEKMEKDIGHIPNYYWLIKNGLSGLARAKTIYPEKFKHIKQDYRKTTPDEWVLEVKEMVKEFGHIPNYQWLKDNGKNALNRCMRIYPEKFKEFTQLKKYNSLDEDIKEVEKIAKNNGGYVPLLAWFYKNNKSGLARKIKLYPNEFSHVKMEDKNRRTDTQWEEILKNILKENENILPSNKKMIEMGYGGMMQYLRKKHPSRYKKIKKEDGHKISRKIRISKTNEKFKKEASSLIKKFGHIPYHKWLKTNGYLMLSKRIREYKELFKGMKQEYYIGRTKHIRIIGE